MRDSSGRKATELYQTLLGLAPPWEVTAVQITQPAFDRPLGEIAVTCGWLAGYPAHLPAVRICGPGL